ncbi:MAG: ClpXP protease specificity-enhancing factor SspB [Methylobacteriaceae bacterium]|jgi:hypothetical protein|nr:ClpXP protease specificity-enhancing factor SspB [Methylobacteriaceae bacterium]
MAQDLIRYDLLVEEAMRKVIASVLRDVARDGLPGQHHFRISFRTDAPGVRLSAAIREKYPTEMVIAIQHQFWDLAVYDDFFEVGLSFSGVPEKLTIPFEAIIMFFDPSVEFALAFEPVPFKKSVEESHEAVVTPLARPGDADSPVGKAAEPAVTRTKASVPKAKSGASSASETEKKPGKNPASAPSTEKTPSKREADVVRLDHFRKKN